MTIEDQFELVAQKFGLSSCHIFNHERGWTVFGFRPNAQGYQASVESGSGETISAAIETLRLRLIEGPIRKKQT